MESTVRRSHLLAVAAGLALLAACSSGVQPGGLNADERDMLDRTAEAHAHDAPTPTPISATAPSVEVTGEAVVYATVDGKPVTGYVARPTKSKGNLPGIIVIHEWWGLNDNVRAQARRLAGEGYVTLAVDLYGGKVATQPQDALKLMQALSASPADDNLRQAYDYLDKVAKAPRVGTIGWCLGGHWSFEAALLLPDKVDATVIYYGQVKADDAELAKLNMPILGLFASKDTIVPVAMVESFQAQMRKLGKPVDIHIYEGAAHAFANPSGGAYDVAAAEDAWQRTTAFFRQNL
jgi:carboxymethylenebutenolidase